MSRRILSLALSGFIAIIIINWSCTKLDTTTVGSDLIPAVDNINTFDTSFAITSAQGVFEGTEKDTTKLLLTDNYALGKIVTDPLFGQTDASLFLQLKPGFYPYYIGVPKDTIITADSVVLCLSYKGGYGDTSTLSGQIKLQVFEVAYTQHGDWDSLRTLRDINFEPAIGNQLSPETAIDMDAVKRYKKIGKGDDSVINQIRIRLTDPTFISKIFDADSAYNSEGGFSRDTFFRSKVNNGFAIRMTQGNQLLYTQLSDLNTRLELHYTKKNGGGLDTAMSTFTFNTGAGGSGAPRRSAVANKIVRTRTNPLPTGDQEIYIQASPGTYASLKVPGLSGYSNRIIHRAEIIMEQIPDASSDLLFTPPGFLYIDLVDSGSVPKKWKPVYYDLNPSLAYDPDNKSGLPYYPVTGEVDLEYLGAAPKKVVDAAGVNGTRLTYTLNVTRHLQQMVLKQTPNYEFRVYAPHDIIYPQYAATIYPYVNNIAQGRIRVGGGNSVDAKYRMRLRIIYSPIK